MWDLISLTKRGTHIPCSTRWSLNHRATREVPYERGALMSATIVVATCHHEPCDLRQVNKSLWGPQFPSSVEWGIVKFLQRLQLWGLNVALCKIADTLDGVLVMVIINMTFSLVDWVFIWKYGSNPALKYLKGVPVQRWGETIFFLYYLNGKKHLNINSVSSTNITF